MYKLLYFFKYNFTMNFKKYRDENKYLKLKKLVRNICMELRARTHVRPSVREFDNGRF